MVGYLNLLTPSAVFIPLCATDSPSAKVWGLGILLVYNNNIWSLDGHPHYNQALTLLSTEKEPTLLRGYMEGKGGKGHSEWT